MPPPDMPLFSAFFYGTLMHPKVLTEVINNMGSHLHFCPAILLNHTRLKVRRADYPGVVSCSEGKSIFTRDFSIDETSVRGTLVTGLTESDMYLLDCFEGPEYDRRPVHVHPLKDLENFTMEGYPLAATNIQTSFETSNPPASPIQASTYIHKDISKLEPDLWCFGEFMIKNAHKWYGSDWDESEVAEQTEELWAGSDVKGSIIHRRMAAMVPSVAVAA